MNRVSLSIFILFLLALGTMSVLGPNTSPISSLSTNQHSQPSRPSAPVQSTFNPLLPLVGVFSSQYSNWNITDLTLTTGSTFFVQVNVTNAPAFNGYEFVLYFDQSYIQVASYDLKAGIFNNPFAASQFSGNGSLRLAVVNLGPLVTVSNGPLLSITFKIVKSGGVSPLVLAAPTANPSPYAAAPPSICNACPNGSPDWTRLVAGGTALDVQTQDGYFKNVGGNIGPVASFITNPLNPTQGSIVNFNASSSYDPDNRQASNQGILRYMWDFGDKSNQANLTSYSPFVSHIFNAIGYPNSGFTGNFSIRLTVIDMDNGFQGMVTLRLEITGNIVHDVGITGLSLTTNPVPSGQNASMVVTVSNFGTSSETYNLTMTYGPQNVTFVRLSGLTISAGNTNTFQFTLSTKNLAAGIYKIIATVSDRLDTNPLDNVAVGLLQVVVPDELPTASLTFNPRTPVVGQDVIFNGNNSLDPDGMINVWSWTFGDGSFQQQFGYAFADHVYYSPGNYTVTLRVTDSSGLMASETMTIQVVPRPQHDVGLVFVQPYPPVAVSGQQISLEAGIVNTGFNSSTVDLTFYYNGKVAVTQHGLLIPATPYTDYVYVQWDTTGISAGNYTISATVFLSGDPTPADNSLTGGQLMLLPPPVLTLVPSSGPVGTLVLIHGSGFVNTQQQFYPVEVQVTFDNQLVGFFFIQSSSFNFSFDVPDAQLGLHQVHAVELFGLTLDVQATFTVTAPPAAINVSVSVGTIYFPGDTATIFIMTSLNGQASPVGSLQVVLIRPGLTNITLTTVRTATGVYKATYTIPSAAAIGTYAVIVKAHQTGSGDGSALASFEVKPSWLSSNGKNIATGVAITGLVGVAALAWRKGYFKKNEEEQAP